LIGNIVGGWLIGISLYWFYLHHVSLPCISFPLGTGENLT
jgi:hypothetical protein